MAIGKRIVERLAALKWKRGDLLEKVDGLTPQALYNLIKRDSVRSEWDEQIAEALGVTVLWLVYGAETGYAGEKVTVLSARDRSTEPPLLSELMDVAITINDRGLAELIGDAKALAKQHPRAIANLVNS